MAVPLVISHVVVGGIEVQPYRSNCNDTQTGLISSTQVQRTHVNSPFSSEDMILALEISSAAAAAIAALRDRSRDSAVSDAALVVSSCVFPRTQFQNRH
jgi:hypothetical protein